MFGRNRKLSPLEAIGITGVEQLDGVGMPTIIPPLQPKYPIGTVAVRAAVDGKYELVEYITMESCPHLWWARLCCETFTSVQEAHTRYNHIKQKSVVIFTPDEASAGD